MFNDGPLDQYHDRATDCQMISVTRSLVPGVRIEIQLEADSQLPTCNYIKHGPHCKRTELGLFGSMVCFKLWTQGEIVEE
jgi:hypothetical protein